jgi:hypothetical protein
VRRRRSTRVWSDFGGHGRYVSIVPPRKGLRGWIAGDAAPAVVEGKVIYRYYYEGYSAGEGPSEPAEWWFAVDDGDSPTARGRWVDLKTFQLVLTGDHVRLIPHRRRRVWIAVSVVDPTLGPVPVGSAPDAAGAPVNPTEMARLCDRPVRAVSPQDPASDGLQSWTYHLGWDTGDMYELPRQVAVHVARGQGAFEALLAHGNHGRKPAENVKVPGSSIARRFGGLLIARRADVTVAIDTDGVMLRRGIGWRGPKADEELARQALESVVRG